MHIHIIFVSASGVFSSVFRPKAKIAFQRRPSCRGNSSKCKKRGALCSVPRFWSCVNRMGASQSWGPTRWGGAFAPYKRFAPGKTLAQGQFTCPEHVQSPEGGGGLGPPEPKKKDTLYSVSFFLEVTPGFEPGNEGFADPCLTTWLCHRFQSAETIPTLYCMLPI